MSAAHCVDGETNVLVGRFLDGTEENFLLLKKGTPGSASDWAILVGNTHGITPLELGEEPDEIEGCLIVGTASYPRAEQRASPCVTTDVVDADYGRTILGNADFGDSGGCVLGAGNKLIGITWGGREEAITYIVTITEIRRALGR